VSDLLEARVQRERSWALQAWTSRLSWGAMRRLANLPESEGGLGYDLSESALKGLVLKAREDAGDMTMNRADRIERQSYEVDERARLARNDLAEASALLRIPRPRRDEFDYIDQWLEALAAWAKTREGAAKMVESADRRLDAAQEREAKLHGLNAATEARLDIVHHDAVALELDAMLERIDPRSKREQQPSP
jgi:hypothetical protein